MGCGTGHSFVHFIKKNRYIAGEKSLFKKYFIFDSESVFLYTKQKQKCSLQRKQYALCAMHQYEALSRLS